MLSHMLLEDTYIGVERNRTNTHNPFNVVPHKHSHGVNCLDEMLVQSTRCNYNKYFEHILYIHTQQVCLHNKTKHVG